MLCCSISADEIHPGAIQICSSKFLLKIGKMRMIVNTCHYYYDYYYYCESIT